MSEKLKPVDPRDMWVLICSLIRYSMGRTSYIVLLSQDLYHKYSHYLSTQDKNQICREVEHELTLRENCGRYLGSEHDHASWQRFARSVLVEVVGEEVSNGA